MLFRRRLRFARGQQPRLGRAPAAAAERSGADGGRCALGRLRAQRRILQVQRRNSALLRRWLVQRQRERDDAAAPARRARARRRRPRPPARRRGAAVDAPRRIRAAGRRVGAARHAWAGGRDRRAARRLLRRRPGGAAPRGGGARRRAAVGRAAPTLWRRELLGDVWARGAVGDDRRAPARDHEPRRPARRLRRGGGLALLGGHGAARGAAGRPARLCRAVDPRPVGLVLRARRRHVFRTLPAQLRGGRVGKLPPVHQALCARPPWAEVHRLAARADRGAPARRRRRPPRDDRAAAAEVRRLRPRLPRPLPGDAERQLGAHQGRRRRARRRREKMVGGRRDGARPGLHRRLCGWLRAVLLGAAAVARPAAARRAADQGVGRRGEGREESEAAAARG